MQSAFSRSGLFLCFLAFILCAFSTTVAAQSLPQRPDPKGNDKKNQRPKPKTAEELKAEEEEKKRLEEEKNATV
ncbi:MAG: hypothetical protein M3Q26_04420, partial [Acidobacteriota bacterium]|nr:hypothetical protein [Acidobacteriota bacterium]